MISEPILNHIFLKGYASPFADIKICKFPPALMYTLHLLQVPTLQVISDKVLSQLLKTCSRSFFLIITIFISLSIGNR